MNIKLDDVDMGAVLHERSFDGWKSWFCESDKVYNIVLFHDVKGCIVYGFVIGRKREALEVFWGIDNKSVSDSQSQILPS